MTEQMISLQAQPEALERLSQPVYAPYQRLRQLIRPGATVLDIGCGNGKVGLYLAEAGAVVDGIEPSDSRVDVAKSRLRYVSEQWAGPGFDDPELDETYDLVLMLDVIEHIPDPEPVIAWAAGRVSPGGALCALIPNSAHWQFRLKMLRGDWRYTPSGLFDRTHVRFFNPETAGELCPAGFVETVRLHPPIGRTSPAPLVRIYPSLFALHTYLEWRSIPA